MTKLCSCLQVLTALFIVSLASAQGGPANEHNCPTLAPVNFTGTQAVPAYVGPGTANFTPSQSLCLPAWAPVGGSMGVLAFVVQGGEPGIRVDSQGTIYVESIRAVPEGVDLWRWHQSTDGPPNADGSLPFKYEGQPDNCGILANGCANNVGSPTNPGVAPGGGDFDIAVNDPDPVTGVPNLAGSSLTLAPGLTAVHSTDRGDSFSVPNVVAALIPGDDRQWLEGVGDATHDYMSYHDAATLQIDVQRSNDGGMTYTDAFGIGIDANTFPSAQGTAATVNGMGLSGNHHGPLRVDRSHCPSRGNVYTVFSAPDNPTENMNLMPRRTMYIGVAADVSLGVPNYTFVDHKIFTSPPGSFGAVNGTDNIFPALAVDDFGYLYAAWSDAFNIFYSFSANQGVTWSAPIQVNQAPTTGGRPNIFPWIAAEANGHVAVAWYGANLVGTPDDVAAMEPGATRATWAQWNVYIAETVNGNAASPTFTETVANDHVFHLGTICTNGSACASGTTTGDVRNLLDFFQIAFDPTNHLLNLTYADDHEIPAVCTNQTAGHCTDPNDPAGYRVAAPYFTRQKAATPGIVIAGACAREM